MAQKGVRTQHPEYIAMAPRWKQCRDAAEGEAAIHAATQAYLPKLAAETDDDYKKRLARTLFSAVHGVVTLGLEQKIAPTPPETLYEQIDSLVALIAAGLEKEGRG